MKKGMNVLFCILFLGLLLGGCSNQSETVVDYYPIRENLNYRYEGSGNEFASYDVFIDDTSENKVQRRINNGGTELVEVVEVANGKVTCVFRQAETYDRENFLDRESNIQEVILMEPIKVGTSWKLSDGSARTITGTSVEVETPSGNYSTVSVETENKYGKTTDYYAKDVGLVKSVTTGEDYEISSSLSEILEHNPDKS